MHRTIVPTVAKTRSVRYRILSWSYVAAFKPAQSNGFAGALSRQKQKEVSSNAATRLERQARTPVRPHQGRAARARFGRGKGRGDRRANSQQRARPARRDATGEPDLHPRPLVGSPGRSPLPPRLRRPDLRPAAQRGERAWHQGPLAHEQSRAGESPQPLATLTPPGSAGHRPWRRRTTG